MALDNLHIRFATENDIKTILNFIYELAEFEKLRHEVIATEESLRKHLFGSVARAEVLLICMGNNEIGFALFFHNFSTFVGKPGLYLEDLYVKPAFRGFGIGKAIFYFLAQLALERDCGRIEWWVLNWNKKAINFYQNLGAIAMDDWSVFRLSEDKLKTLAKLNKFQCTS
ncbi:GNAT family N-acetyltransferase [Thiotrichales bacterium 19S3-7]|nr:GNAT family N-acetyltransferase [Thiotrichales bacterium 19S3-7]MCF6802375.1 GNAT family N-acetyltransferase [Thiotrichales bacterium 19S3-11]